MTERQPCRRCQRTIDAMAGHCPFCNWDQAQPAPPPGEMVAAPPPANVYTPPREIGLRKVIGVAAGIAVMLVVAFLFGMLINRDGAPDRAPDPIEEQAAEHNAKNQAPRRANTPLVPAGEGGIAQTPITSAPVAVPPGQAPDDYQRTDATAVSAEEYAQMARRAETEKKKKMAVLVDPRSLTGPAYAQGATEYPVRRSRPAAMADGTGASQNSPVPRRPAVEARRGSGVRTRPIPQHQPLPAMRGQGSAKFTLLVGADGRVKDVNIERTMAGGNTPALVGAIQNWRFRPATENGEPVAAPFSVEISFGRE